MLCQKTFLICWAKNIIFIDNFGALDEEFELSPSFELFIAEDIARRSVKDSQGMLKFQPLKIAVGRLPSGDKTYPTGVGLPKPFKGRA